MFKFFSKWRRERRIRKLRLELAALSMDIDFFKRKREELAVDLRSTVKLEAEKLLGRSIPPFSLVDLEFLVVASPCLRAINEGLRVINEKIDRFKEEEYTLSKELALLRLAGGIRNMSSFSPTLN